MENLFDNEEKILKQLSRYEIEIGVISEDSKRKDVVSVGMTNAELMFIHENGSPTRNIPARPVLEMTIDWVNNSGLLESTIDLIIDKVINEAWDIFDIEEELNKLCVRMENYAREIIYSNDGRLAPNAEKTAYKKWKKEKHSKNAKWKYPEGNHPLFDTGQLARSITCRLVRN